MVGKVGLNELNERKETNVTTWKVEKEETSGLDVIIGHCTKKKRKCVA